VRKRFQAVVSDLIEHHDTLVLLLGDIGVFGFKDSIASHPRRVLNIGILEQAMTSFAAGLALSGKIPILHTIAPFLIERPYEQLKIDFGYQGLSGKFVSVGGSFDYAALGATHHAPGDITALLAIPGFEIFLPANSEELENMLRTELLRESLSYFRLSESEFSDPRLDPSASMPQLLSKSSNTVIVAFGTAVKEGVEVSEALDLSLIYMNAITTVSVEKLTGLLTSSGFRNVVILQPFYQGSISHLIQKGLNGKYVLDLGVPRKFIHDYGTVEEIKLSIGLDGDRLKSQVEEFINEQ